MTILFPAPTRLGAWLAAAEHLISRGPDLNIILSIDSPVSDGVATRAARALVDSFYASEGKEPLHTVAETIFPGWEYRHRGLRGVLDIYPKEYELLKGGAPGRWGTYAYRLLRRKNGKGETLIPLKILIDKMRSELRQENRGKYRSCYEIGIAEGEYDLPLYSTTDDPRRRRGGPCLSHLSFKLFEGRVHLAAIYRSHDYRYKAIGNLLGLARLQACVAHEVGLPMGSLVVHSTYAYIDPGKGKKAFASLVSGLRSLLDKESNDDVDN